MANILDPKTGLLLAAPYQSNQFVATKRDRRWMAFFASRVVSDTACASLPTSPVEGQAVICSGGANANAIARYSTDLSAWEYLAPWAGLVVQDTSGNSWCFGGSSWAQQATGGSGGSGGTTVDWRTTHQTVIPAMASSNAPSGVVSASSYYYTNPPYRAFDANWGGWICDGAGCPSWIQYQFPAAKIIKSYAIAPWANDAFPARWLASWTLSGSSDGNTWTVVDTRSQPFRDWTLCQLKLFEVASPGAYLYYRLTILANGGNNYVGLQRLEMYAC